MPTRRPSTSFMPKRAVLWLALFAVSCVVDRQVLDQALQVGGSSSGVGGKAEPPSPPQGGTENPPGSGGSGGAMPVFWGDCLDALRGHDGDGCDPTAFPCQFQQGCTLRYAACQGDPAVGFALIVGTDTSQCSMACTTDGDCVAGNWCIAGTCQPCTKEEMCQPNWEVVDRNGCVMCAPRNQCKDNSGCGMDETCMAGQTCLPGCRQNDPSCCYGNLCVNRACPPPDRLDCSIVGCALEARCIASTPAKCFCGAPDYVWQCDPAVSSNFCK